MPRAVPPFVVAVALAVAASGCGGPREGPTDARFLHVLLVADTLDPEIGESVVVDLWGMRAALEAGVPAARLGLRALEGEAVDPPRILAAVRDLPVGPDDAVLVHYSGHGAWSDAGPYLRMRGGRILERADLLAALRAKRPRLLVVLTDCCGTYVGETPLAKPYHPDPDVFRDLFFRHRGVVDVTAASRGQVAVGDRRMGGYFTAAVLDALTAARREDLDADGDRVVAWAEVLARVREATRATFAGFQPRGLALGGATYDRQEPCTFGEVARPAAGPIPPPAWRLGVEVRAAEGGAVVSAVHAPSPAAWAGIEPGEVLVQVTVPGDGPFDEEAHEIAGAGDLARLLAACPGPRLLRLTTRLPGASGSDGREVRRERLVRLGP